MAKLINTGSIDDIRCYLKLNEKNYSIEQLVEEIKAEEKGKGRSSVINMLNAAIKRKYKK